MSIHSKFTAIANKIRSILGTTSIMTLDDMNANLTDIDNEVADQTDVMIQIKALLVNKAVTDTVNLYDSD